MELGQLRTALLLAAVCNAALGNTVVVPTAEATKSGNMPINLTANAIRIQQTIGSGQFSGPITIIALRVRSSPGTGRVDFTEGSLQVTLSTTQAYPNTANGHTLPSMTYASNVGPDATVVYKGPVSASSPGCALPGPCSFDIVIPFTTPFSYDPTKGRLLIDVTSSTSSGLAGSLDGVSFADTTSSTVASVSGDPAQPMGSLSTSGFVYGLEAGTPCTATGTVYPCSVAGTLLVTSAPTGDLFSGGGGGGGGGVTVSIIDDPQNPGFSFATTTPLQANGPTNFSLNGTVNVATVSGQPTINGGKASVTCGVTGAATLSLTISTPGGSLVLNCPKVSTAGMTMTVTGQRNFSPVSSLTMMVALSGTAASGTDTLTVGGYSLQVQLESSLPPGPTVTGVTNSADFSAHLSPGALAQVYGMNLWTGAAMQCPANGCPGLTVTVGGKPAYVLYASAGMLVIQIPYELAPGSSNVIVTDGGAPSSPLPITLAAVAPAFFTQNSAGTGPALITTQKSSLVTFGVPAHPGDTLTASATGLGITNPPTASGIPAASNPAAAAPVLTIAGTTATVLYAGSVQGQVGLDQVNFTVPQGLQGTQPIVLTSGTASSSSSVTIPIAGVSRLVSNGGFGSAGMAAPGEIATVFANGLGTTDQLMGFPATTFQGTQVTFNGTAAPLFHLVASTAQQKPPAEQQIDLLVPQELPTTGTVNVQLTTSSAFYPNYGLTMAPAVPGLFRIQDPSNSKRFNVIATFPNSAWLALPDSTTSALKLPACSSDINLASYCGQPATLGDTLILWMTGLGITTPNGDPNGKPLATGQIPPADGSVLYETPTLPSVTIGGVPVNVLYSVLAPSYPGDYQVAVQVPTGVASGDDVPVVVTMFGNSDTATISIQPRP